MLRRSRAFIVIWVVCLMTNPAPRAAAQAAPASGSSSMTSSQRDAAAQFDAGVTAYKAGDYTRAAELFLVADGLAPSVTALSNALAAARRVGVPLLMARTAQRSLARTGMSEADKRSARTLLQEVGPKLAQLDVSCENPACAPSIDGIAAAQGLSYAEPGAHRVTAVGAEAQELMCGAGQTCAVRLSALPVVAPAPEQVAKASTPGPSTNEPVSPVAPASSEPARWKRRLPLGVLIGAGVGALLFGGLATWQGVEALHEKQRVEDDRGGAKWSDVKAMAHRSDVFMASGIVLAGVAAATAIWWVDWDAQSRSHLALLPEGGATLTTRRRF